MRQYSSRAWNERAVKKILSAFGFNHNADLTFYSLRHHSSAPQQIIMINTTSTVVASILNVTCHLHVGKIIIICKNRRDWTGQVGIANFVWKYKHSHTHTTCTRNKDDNGLKGRR